MDAPLWKKQTVMVGDDIVKIEKIICLWWWQQRPLCIFFPVKAKGILHNKNSLEYNNITFVTKNLIKLAKNAILNQTFVF